MQAYHAKWRQLHDSSKNRIQSPTPLERFRSSSKDYECSDHIPIGMRSIGKLLPSSINKQESMKQSQTIEYYQNGKESEMKMKASLRNPKTLQKQLIKIGDSRPQDKIVVDSAITLIHKYQQEIHFLQQQVTKLKKSAGKKTGEVDLIAMINQDKNEDYVKNDLFASERTVQSLPSGKKVVDAKNVCAEDYYFSNTTH